MGRFKEWCKNENAELTVESLSPRALYLWQVFTLQKGGFPFTTEDLDPGDWLDLGWIKIMFDKIDMEFMAKTLFGDGKSS